jgi:flagellar biosynthesis/type III secretory pathway protein FliH
MRSRIIGKEQAGEIDRWDVPSVDASAADALRGAHKGSAHLLTAGQLDALQQQVHDEAFKRGFDEGLAAGKAELASRVARRWPSRSASRSKTSSARWKKSS